MDEQTEALQTEDRLSNQPTKGDLWLALVSLAAAAAASGLIGGGGAGTSHHPTSSDTAQRP